MTSFSERQISLRWRRFRPKYRLRPSPLPMIALVNVALLIMLFVVWGSQIILRPGMIVQLPVAAFVSGTPYGTLVVTVTQEGLVFFNDDQIPMDRLGSALGHAVRKNKDAAMTIEADARVSYETIIRVMNMGAATGIRQINLATRPSFGEEVMP